MTLVSLIRKSHSGNPLEFTPPPGTVLPAHAHDVPNPSPDGNGFHIPDLPYDLEMHTALCTATLRISRLPSQVRGLGTCPCPRIRGLLRTTSGFLPLRISRLLVRSGRSTEEVLAPSLHRYRTGPRRGSGPLAPRRRPSALRYPACAEVELAEAVGANQLLFARVHSQDQVRPVVVGVAHAVGA
jgi:hypothetical protein